MKIGVLAIQGDFAAHVAVLDALGASAIEVRTLDQLADADALVIPGGESTTLRIVGARTGMLDALRSRAADGMPVFGTCAGMIACAAQIADGDEPLLGHIDITVRRNAYGRQVDSFECDLDVSGIGAVRAVFIRAPRVERVGDGVEVLASWDGSPVVVRSGASILTAFHPEIAGEGRLHRAFLSGLD